MSCNKVIYTSCGCNKSPNTLDWGNNNLICYGASNSIHLFKYEGHYASYMQTLFGHKKLITSVHWIKNSYELISTSADCTASIWTLKDDKFIKTASMIGHNNVVRNACGIYFLDVKIADLLVATLSSDSSLKVWQRRTEGIVECIQTISFGNGFGLDAKFAFLNTELVLLVGADDAKIHVYVQDHLDQFNLVLSLKGHEDWIQSLDVIYKDNSTLMVASASQDSYIRIWKILPKQSRILSENGEFLKLDENIFYTPKGDVYSVFLESVLSGHENWIYSVQWSINEDTLQILSTSMDKTMIIWEMDSNSNMWTEKIRVGEVGGNTLGLLGGVFSPCGRIIIAHGYQGAIHLWKLNEYSGAWEPGLTFGGHFSSVLDIDWDPEGEYLISCSLDQTTRIHAPYLSSDLKINWFEIGRPQVHGYDMVCLTLLNRFQFVSAGDEKVLRAFQAPRSFAEALKNISNIDTSGYTKNNVAEGASVPSLGLSNKAVFEDDLSRAKISNDSDVVKHPKDRYPEFYYTPLELTAPATEETLLQNTLWPEVQKLYGHPYEVFTVTSNHSHTLIASTCRASKAEHAAIILWDTSNWHQVGQLIFHKLTVTQQQFSPDDEFLLSVSRDRMWAVFQHFPSETPPYRLIASLDKKSNVHTRIIWSCSWTSNSSYFATASRDKKIAVWGKTKENSGIKFSLCLKPLEVEDSATAIAFAPYLIHNKNILAIGLENGHIILSSWCEVSGFTIHMKLEETIAHHMTVNKLKFSPTYGEAGKKKDTSNVIQLASCSNDNHVKIYEVIISLVI